MEHDILRPIRLMLCSSDDPACGVTSWWDWEDRVSFEKFVQPIPTLCLWLWSHYLLIKPLPSCHTSGTSANVWGFLAYWTCPSDNKMWDYNQNWKTVCPDIFLFLAGQEKIYKYAISRGLSADLTQSPTLHSSQLTRSEVFPLRNVRGVAPVCSSDGTETKN